MYWEKKTMKGGKAERRREDSSGKRNRRRRKINTDVIIRERALNLMIHITYVIYLIFSRFLCSTVEDFVVDNVKAWNQIKQNTTTVESVILKVSFLSFCLIIFVELGPLFNQSKCASYYGIMK